MGGCSRCFVPNCHKTGSDDRKTHLPFRNVQLLYKWLNAIKNPISLDRNLEYFRRIRVCTKHFEEQHVIPRFYPSCNNKAVKPYAVPSLYLPRGSVENRCRYEIIIIFSQWTRSGTFVSSKTMRASWLLGTSPSQRRIAFIF